MHMAKKEIKKKEVAKKEFLNEFLKLLEMLRPISHKMMSHHDLSSKPIKELKRLVAAFTEFLIFCEENKDSRTIRSLDKKVRSIILFQKGPFRNEVFLIESTSISFHGETFEHKSLIEIIDNLKHYQEAAPFGQVKIDPDFSIKHRHYHQLVSYVRSSVIDLTEQLDTIYKKETKPSRLSFLKIKS